MFHEAVTNRIVDDLVAPLDPRFLRLTANWYVRGGITTTIVAEHRKRGWKPAPRIAARHRPAGARSRACADEPAARAAAALPFRAPARAARGAGERSASDWRRTSIGGRGPDRRINLSIGEPAAMPASSRRPRCIAARSMACRRIRPRAGTPALREAIAGWIERRHGVRRRSGDRSAAGHRLARSPVRVRADRRSIPAGGRCVVAPNPFYQIYEGAALLAGACGPSRRPVAGAATSLRLGRRPRRGLGTRELRLRLLARQSRPAR